MTRMLQRNEGKGTDFYCCFFDMYGFFLRKCLRLSKAERVCGIIAFWLLVGMR